MSKYLAMVMSNNTRLLKWCEDKPGRRVEVVGDPAPEDLTPDNLAQARRKHVADWKVS